MSNYKNRDYSYDWLRAFAAIMIVFCHIFMGFGVSRTLGYYCSSTFVCVFLVLSAFLLGGGHRDTISEAPVRFFQMRMKRLIPTYYLFLTISILLILIITDGCLTAEQIAGHYLFVNWFIPTTRIYGGLLPNFGHLWFMSCIVMAYILIMFFAIFIGNNRKPIFWWIYTCISLMTGTVLCAYDRHFAYISVVTTLFPLMFFMGDKIVATAEKVSKRWIASVLLIFNLLIILAFHFGLYDYPSIMLVVNAANSMLWIVSAPIIFSRCYIPSFVAFLSAISFEIYLVHHPMCLGYYSLNKYMPTWIAVCAVFALTIPLAYLLNKLGRNILAAINRRITPPEYINEYQSIIYNNFAMK